MILTTLRSAVRYLIFDDSTNTSFSNTDLDRELNIKYRKWRTKAMILSGNWQVGATYALIHLLPTIYKYDIDRKILRFSRVEAKLTNAGEYQEIKPIDVSSITGSLEDYKPASPEYDLRDGYLTIYTDKIIEDVDDGLKLYVDKDLTDLINTNDEPDIAEPLLDILITDTAITYCQTNQMWNKVTDLKNTIRERLPDFEDLYSSRSQNQNIIKGKKKNYR